ncbi:ABC transporter permease, partial [bacterium]|nr:ABC transporter permease [bacterium]
MENLTKYIISRLFQWLIVVFVGITVVFIIPRFTPMDPIQTTLNRVTAYSYIDPDAINKMIETLKDLYGLKGTILQQYVNFWKHLLLGDLGPSLSLFPTSVMDVIRTSLPWTIGLLMVSTFLSWITGILLG